MSRGMEHSELTGWLLWGLFFFSLKNPTVYRKPRAAVALSQILRGCSLSQGEKPPYCSSTKPSEEFLCAILSNTLGILPQLLL